MNYCHSCLVKIKVSNLKSCLICYIHHDKWKRCKRTTNEGNHPIWKVVTVFTAAAEISLCSLRYAAVRLRISNSLKGDCRAEHCGGSAINLTLWDFLLKCTQKRQRFASYLSRFASFNFIILSMNKLSKDKFIFWECIKLMWNLRGTKPRKVLNNHLKMLPINVFTL